MSMSMVQVACIVSSRNAVHLESSTRISPSPTLGINVKSNRRNIYVGPGLGLIECVPELTGS